MEVGGTGGWANKKRNESTPMCFCVLSSGCPISAPICHLFPTVCPPSLFLYKNNNKIELPKGKKGKTRTTGHTLLCADAPNPVPIIFSDLPFLSFIRISFLFLRQLLLFLL